MTAQTSLLTACSRCDGTGCTACRTPCRICEQQGRDRLANAGGRYCDDHDPASRRIPY